MKKFTLFIASVLFFTQSKAVVDSITIRSSPANSMFRYVDNTPLDSGSNFPSTSMVIARWTSGGTPYIWRSMLKFNLSAIPAGSIIDSAWISLYANTASPSANTGSPTWGTDNAVGIYRITSAWDTATVTWGTQPAYATTNAGNLPQSTSWTQDYVKVNVTALVKDAYTYGNYGFLFKHIQEVTPLNSMIFYSPYQYATDSTLTPKLVVRYTNTVAVLDPAKDRMGLNIYPNPANGIVHFEIAKEVGDVALLQVMDITGRVIATKDLNNAGTYADVSLDMASYAKGIYFAKLVGANGKSVTKKLLIN